MGNWIRAAIIVIGVGLGVTAVAFGMQTHGVAKPIAEPATAPYSKLISGVGIVEPSSKIIKVGTERPGIVDKIYVHVGDKITKGEPLFSVDTRALQASLAIRQANLKVAEANVVSAKAELAEKKQLYNLILSVTDKRAVSIEEVDRSREAVHIGIARLEAARASVESAKAEIEAAKTAIATSTFHSPIDGTVLAMNINVGEYAAAGELSTPLMLIGTIDPLHVRVEIDEIDAGRFTPQGKAFASIRGRPKVHIPLTFVRLEPYVVPKTSLTGDTAERVDTRVLQVIYSFRPDDYPVYVGQQVDVFIEEPLQD